MTDLQCDVAIIGGGTAGLAAERSARRKKAKTLLIDDRFAGTTCATVGCMPSKLLIAAADAAHAVRRAGRFGIRAAEPTVDSVAVMERVRRLRDDFARRARASFAEVPSIVQARAHFASPTELLLDDGRRVTARAIVIATGSRPSIPKAFEAVREHVLTNESIFELKKLPSSIAVIGAGPEGVELGQALARLGVETMIFDESDHFAGLHDEAVAADFHELLSEELPIHLGMKLDAKLDEDAVLLSWSGKNESGKKHFDRVLLAAGRPPSVKGLDLEKADLELDEDGVPKFDKRTLQCGNTPVFIVGDASHDRPVLHEASSEGTIAGRNAATYPNVTPGTRGPALAIVFTDPPAATVGRVPKKDEPHVLGKVSFENQGRARVFERNAGLVHLYADPKEGKILGATMTGPAVEHIAHFLALALAKQMTASELLDIPYYHPTYEEALKTALREICVSVHAPVPDDRDEGTLPGT